MLHDWAANGVSALLATARSGIVALPLLLILQITQYLRYLDHHGLSHDDFLAGVAHAGGIQGYCGGLPSAMTIACAKDEAGVIKHTAIAMRNVLGVGAYGQAADDMGGTGSTTLAMRLKYEGQGNELTRQFPGTHISAITEPRSVSTVGPAGKLHELYCFARDHEGLQRGVRPTKTVAHGLIRTHRIGRIPAFPDTALAVVGASYRLPGARNLDELWSMMAAGADLHKEPPIDRFDVHGSFRATQSGNLTKGRTFYGNLIDDVQRFDHGFLGVNPREAVNMDPQQRILLELAHEALESAGYLATHCRDDGDNVGCFIGASFVEYLDNTSAHAPTAYTQALAQSEPSSATGSATTTAGLVLLKSSTLPARPRWWPLTAPAKPFRRASVVWSSVP
ncbi:ketoacyl-synt-domain-containing protein [Parathielavia hyrcaniae]|uniref:Ketoacyl-synt-domain-containing protein n=1 Tax=Parathielavia hyrcaniae TaxID=113614 RepID=A0AAN6SWW6_9PEZI|nr:ketoacyl-synt-domain-containing protein [Parathielavia hyrcaniae]